MTESATPPLIASAPQLSYRTLEPISAELWPWRGIARVAGVVCALYALATVGERMGVLVFVGWRWAAGGVLGLAVFLAALVLALAVIPFGIAVAAGKSSARRPLVIALVVLVVVQLLSGGLSGAVSLSERRYRTAEEWQWIGRLVVAVTPALSSCCLPALAIALLTRRNAAESLRAAKGGVDLPRVLEVLATLAIVAGCGGLLLRPIAFVGGVDGMLGSGASRDVLMLVWVLISRLVLLGCAGAMVTGGVGALGLRRWAPRVLSYQARVGVVVNMVDIGLALGLVTISTSAERAVGTLLFGVSSLVLDVVLLLYFTRGSTLRMFESGDGASGEPRPVLAMGAA